MKMSGIKESAAEKRVGQPRQLENDSTAHYSPPVAEGGVRGSYFTFEFTRSSHWSCVGQRVPLCSPHCGCRSERDCVFEIRRPGTVASPPETLHARNRTVSGH